MNIHFTLLHSDRISKARYGTFRTDHGIVETPVFMPVGTIATVKGLTPEELKNCKVQVLLSNTYHLYLRPGLEILEKFGGLHRFNAWNGPILTDSGGFQIYSLDDLKEISEAGVEFKSHYDGSKHLFTPENVVETQRSIGSDIMMVLDYLTGNPSDFEISKEAHLQTIRWAQRARDHFLNSKPLYDYRQFQFGIVQGGIYEELRRASAAGLMDIGFDGYAIGGLAVGEDRATRYRITDLCTDLLPQDQPRYLMGVGKPEDILDGIELGVDMFDCVIPSRNGRNGSAFSYRGRLNIRNAKHRDDQAPIDGDCQCYCCTHFSRGYLHHMMKVNEMLALRMITLHNIHFYQDLTIASRSAIKAGNFTQFKREMLEKYGERSDPEAPAAPPAKAKK